MAMKKRKERKSCAMPAAAATKDEGGRKGKGSKTPTATAAKNKKTEGCALLLVAKSEGKERAVQ